MALKGSRFHQACQWQGGCHHGYMPQGEKATFSPYHYAFTLAPIPSPCCLEPSEGSEAVPGPGSGSHHAIGKLQEGLILSKGPSCLSQGSLGMQLVWAPTLLLAPSTTQAQGSPFQKQPSKESLPVQELLMVNIGHRRSKQTVTQTVTPSSHPSAMALSYDEVEHGCSLTLPSLPNMVPPSTVEQAPAPGWWRKLSVQHTR